ncbi:hypothetical protein D3C87_797720 [compost metagenome]
MPRIKPKSWEEIFLYKQQIRLNKIDGSEMEKRIIRKPAAYPKTSLTEQISADIFHKLVDRRYIRGNVTVMDKVPNTDGFLTLLDDQQISIGHFDVQLKTLTKRKAKSPRFQCDISLMAYALDSILPVFLLVVDQEKDQVYWMHLDQKLVKSISPNSTARTFSLYLDPKQVITGTDGSYISEWKKIILRIKTKLQDFDDIEKQRQTFFKLLRGANPRLIPAYSINELAFREIHLFLDVLNISLDTEFKTIKDILFPNSWKLAIALMMYERGSCNFFILPIPLSSNSPLILEVADSESISMDEVFQKDKALLMMAHYQDNPIRENPKLLAIKLLQQEVFKVINNKRFAMDSIFLAKEYVFSFAFKFRFVLGYKNKPLEVDIRALKRIVFVLMPIIRELECGPSTGDISHYIDHFAANRSQEYLTMLQKAEKKLSEGFIPNPRLKMISRLFDLELLKYYLDFLEQNGLLMPKGDLLPMIDNNIVASLVWESWVLPNMFDNLKKILLDFPKLYQALIDHRFPLLKKELDFFGEYSVILFLFVPKYENDEPSLLYFKFSTKEKPLRQILLFHANEENCPPLIDDDFEKIWDRSFDFDSCLHNLQQRGGYPLEFLITNTPMHRLINDILGKKIDAYFKKQGLESTDYKPFQWHNVNYG